MNIQQCKIRPEIINIISNETLLYPHIIILQINVVEVVIISRPICKMYVPDVKNIYVRVFNLMSRNNETRHKMV